MKWIAYWRYSRDGSAKSTIVRPENEPAPKYYSQQRPATADEIAAEIEDRRQREEEKSKQEAFTSRREYKTASLIRSALEFMTPDNHLLDRLTPDEWDALYEKLRCGELIMAETKTAKHTPTPWSIAYEDLGHGNRGPATLCDSRPKPIDLSSIDNLQFIVRAVNRDAVFDDLVRALEEISRPHKCTDGQFRQHAQTTAAKALARAREVSR